MKMFGKLFGKKINDKSDKQRLSIVRSERPLREGFNSEHYQDVLDAREYLFNETVELRKVETNS